MASSDAIILALAVKGGMKLDRVFDRRLSLEASKPMPGWIFLDQNSVQRSYPYVAAGSLVFNSILVGGYYKMYFTTLPGASNDYGEAGAVVVDDGSAADIAGTIGSGSIGFTFDYDNNTQGGRTPGTDAAVTVVAGNPGSAKPVVATGTISRACRLRGSRSRP